jgi:hypothetical protein
MHPSDVLSEDGQTYLNNAALYEEGDYHFRQHQVANHSIGFVTEDQIRGNQTPGYIYSNTIEGIWKNMKIQIAPCFRNEKYCHKKILEFLWRRENANLIDRINRAFREAEFYSGPINSDRKKSRLLY